MAQRKKAVLNALAALLAVWAAVWGIREFAGARKITAESLSHEMNRAGLADWSDLQSPPNPAEARQREEHLRKVAGMLNRLDFQEREKNRRNRGGEDYFRKLSPAEKNLFIDLTLVESMNRFMESLDALPPAQRKKFVEQGLREIQNGQTEDDIARAEELGADLLDRISQEGMRAYFEKSTAQTKLDLAPLMEAISETMQGLRGNEFHQRSQ